MMKRLIWTKAILATLLVVTALSVSHTPVAANPAAEAVRIAGGRIGDANPEVRAQAVADLARANNKDGARFMMQCMATESDGPAGWRMAEAVRMLTSQEALEEVEKHVLKWNKPENLFGAYWTFLGLAAAATERGDQILRKAIEETKDKDIYIRSAAIEAIAGAERRDMADLLLAVLKTYDPKWDENSPIIALTCIHGAPKVVSASDMEMRNKIVLALADVLEKTADDRIQWFTCKALSTITGEDTYIDAEFWRWWVQMGGKKVERRDEGATVAGRDVPKFFKAAAVGKRVVFLIDISGSMQHPVELPPEMKNPPKEEKEEPQGPVTGKGKGAEEEVKKEIPPPDYSKVQTKLDLAKVELIHTLTHLPDDYWFNIVIYHTPHMMIDSKNDEFVRATDANKRAFIKKVEALNWAELTNIYGALKRGFCVNMKDTIDPDKIGKRGTNDPAWDPECLKTGATTMFFLTDGSPTVTDDTIGEVRSGRLAQGAARYCQPQNIVDDVRRLNVFRKVVINTVGIGPHMGNLLSALAQMSGGEYIDRSGIAPR
jgi:hypothetical protein